MKKNFFIIVVSLLCSSLSSAQQDPAAKEILDKFTRKAESGYPLLIEFEYIYESVIDNESFTDTGKLILNGGKYRLTIRDSEIFCDGETLWNHNITADEVYISNPVTSAANDEFFLSNPEDLFHFYDNDFKYRLTGELNYMGRNYYQVDLFPKDLNKSYHTITLLINQDDYRLYSIGTKGKQGINHTFIIKDYQAKYKTNENTFRFDLSVYPDIEVVDTRL